MSSLTESIRRYVLTLHTGPRPEASAVPVPLKGTPPSALEREIATLRQELIDETKDLLAKQELGTLAEPSIESLREKLASLEEKEALSFVANRIHEEARDVFLESRELQNAFLTNRSCQAYVMSVDVRRSTSLMLKARRPELFAGFITTLGSVLRKTVLECQGVFDKFTGDGILAYFPDFYSGLDGGYYAIQAAERCHKAFSEHYREYRSAFSAIIKDVGLGIGVDHGEVNLIRIGNELTVVGTPVVYACRMAGAPAGVTLANQPGYEQILSRFGQHCELRPTEIDVKNEGVHLCHAVVLRPEVYVPQPPVWQIHRRSASS